MGKSSKSLFIGLDVHKDTITVAYAAEDHGRTWCRWGRLARGSTTSTSVRLCKRYRVERARQTREPGRRRHCAGDGGLAWAIARTVPIAS
jgi:hypothetical protein